LGQTDRTYFVADLHLTDERPDAAGRFFRFLESEVEGADALYILGDLFEAWVGDDHEEHVARDTARRLKLLANAGTNIYFMHGNRDFMLAQRYAASSGMHLLSDPTAIELYGVTTLLMHGDTLCTDDTTYQTFRRRVRRPWVLTLLRWLPLSLRHRMAHQARTRSESAKSGKATEIMDVNSAEVIRVLRVNQASRLIHGHTHRPAQHHHEIEGRRYERWVLPDWYTRWGYVVCDATGCSLNVNNL